MTFERVIATLGTIVTLPPAAPVVALVRARSVVVALSETLAPPVSVPLRPAVVTSSMSESATDAPSPKEVVPSPGDCDALASVVASELEEALTDTSPLPAFTVPVMSASVRRLMRLRANAPATLTEPPPAPEIAVAMKSLPSLAGLTSAFTVAGPFAVPAIVAVLVIRA